MSITVADCLKMPSLKMGKVIGGKKGMGKVVTSVTTFEFYDEKLANEKDKILSSELVVTAFYSIRNDVDKQCETIRLLNEVGNCGLILAYVGICVPHVDKRIIELADELQFPVIVLPEGNNNFRYSEAIMEVTEAITNDRRKKKTLNDSIVNYFNNFEDSQRTIDNLLRFLCDNQQCSLILADKEKRIVSYAMWPASKPVERSLEECDFNKESGKTAVEINVEAGNLVLYGIDESNRDIHDEMLEISEAIELFSKVWRLRLALSSEEVLVSGFVKNDADIIMTAGDSNKEKLDQIKCMLIIQSEKTEKSTYEKLVAVKNTAKAMVTDLANTVIASVVNETIVILYGDKKINVNDEDISEYVMAELISDAELFMASFVNLENAEKVAECYKLFESYGIQAKKIYGNLKNLGIGELTFVYDAIRRIKKTGGKEELWQHVSQTIENQRDSDELFNTVAAFLFDTNCELKATAENMYLHRNTIQYRLNKIKSITGCDPSKMPDAYPISIAAAKYRMM